MSKNSFAQPFYFGAQDLFGWYHSSDVNHASVGVVIINPNGYDLMSMHWGWRCLAERLTAAGIPAMRFDLHGTGDSSGDDRNPDRLQAWLSSINDAVDVLKARSNVSQVVLLGTRLGGTLAALASIRDDVVGVVLYVPCTSGRTYVREVKAMAATALGTHVEMSGLGSGNDVVMAGWLLTEQTVSELSKLDLTRQTFPGKHVLYMHRGDVSPDQKLVLALQSASNVSVQPAIDYPAFAQDALFGKEPVNDFAQIIKWLQALPGNTNSKVDADIAIKHELVREGFTERPLQFGEQGRLFGILCRPSGETKRPPPCVVFINTAANHHIGTQRMAVKLSRELAAHGIASLRMDIGGIGDSAPAKNRIPNQVFNMLSVDDVVAAADMLGEHGLTDLTLTGICSGAYLCYYAAMRDARLKSLVLVNLYQFIWIEGSSLEFAVNSVVPGIRVYVRRMLHWSTWKRFFFGGINFRFIIPILTRKILKNVGGILSRMKDGFGASGKSDNDVLKTFKDMLQHGTRIRMIYSGGDGGLDAVATHLGKHASALRNSTGFEFNLVPGADHTYTAPWASQKLLELYCEHVLAKR